MAFTNTRRVRIEWGDCDPAGIIFYPRYFDIFDASAAALFERALGITKFEMFKTLPFAGFPLARTHAKFIKPTRFGDDVTVDSTITFGRSRSRTSSASRARSASKPRRRASGSCAIRPPAA